MSEPKDELLAIDAAAPREVSELDRHQRREKINTRGIEGRFQRLRLYTGWPLLLGYFLLPWLMLQGQQAVLFDLPARRFHILTLTFWPQDLVLLGFMLIIAAFAFYHLAHYTWKVPQINGISGEFKGDFETYYVHETDDDNQTAFVSPLPDGEGAEGENATDVYRMVVNGFKVPWVVGFYVVAIGLLCVHLSHGLSAMFQSLGLKNKNYGKWMDCGAPLVAVLIFLGYISIPVAVLAGFVK